MTTNERLELIQEAESFEDLETAGVTVEEVKKLFAAKEKQRLYHKKAQVKRARIMELAEARGLTKLVEEELDQEKS